MEYNHLKNGTAKTNSGIKQISFDPETLELRPVLFKVFSGHLSAKGTVQGILDGDVVAQVTWGKSGVHYNVYKNGTDDFTPGQQANMWSALKKKHPWLDAWLEPQERGETNIPESVIPINEYLAVKVKNSRIENAINRFGVPFTLHDFIPCSKGDLQLRPDNLHFNLDEYQPESVSYHNDHCDINKYEEWFGSCGNGSPAVRLDINPTIHLSGSTTAGIPGVLGWQKWKYIVQIKTGIHEKNGKTYGRSFRIWENNKIQSVKE